ncbi:MAG: hypothetical protein FJW69_09555 [Actinobacteria bacterium]|nr:hypothetical protein [Actinomycetota bacterium]
MKGHTEIVKLLIEKDADVNIRDSTGIDTLTITSGKHPKIIDIDGNSYQVVKIGNQLWMAKNLRVTHYVNGDPIPNVTSDRQWIHIGYFTDSLEGAYCYYNNDVNNLSTYGCLYNWFAIIDSRSICPTGWHIPTAEEWRILETYLGGSSVAGGKMKEAGDKYWDFPNTGANNVSGFCALPGGYRNPDGSYHSIGSIAQIWSSTELQDKDQYWTFSCSLRCFGSDLSLSPANQANGFSVRCIKD